MSIKNKKDLKSSRNVYRLERIEKYLICQGYIRTDFSKESYQRWVDCIAFGRDICFDVADITKDNYDFDRGLQNVGGYEKDGYFKIEDPWNKRLEAEASTIEEAVKRSRL